MYFSTIVSNKLKGTCAMRFRSIKTINEQKIESIENKMVCKVYLFISFFGDRFLLSH